MTFIKSKIFIRPIVLYWTVGPLVVGDFFFSNYIPHSSRQTIEIILTFIYIILFLWATFYVLFKTLDKLETENKIEELEEEKEKWLKHFDNFEKENLLLHYKNVRDIFSDKIHFIHFLKTKEELTDRSNIGNYFIILLIFFASQFSFDNLRPVGPIVFLVLALTCFIYCMRILIWEAFVRKQFISPIIIGHGLVIYLLFTWGKNSYIRSYGDEIIGSYFEKPEYRTKYYINMFQDEGDSKNYRLPADIHVYSESEEGETTQDMSGQEHTQTYTTKYIILQKAYWPNGGYLDFEDCQLEIGKKVFCSDQDGKQWYIELTNQKVN